MARTAAMARSASAVRPVGGGADELGGAVQATPGIPAVVGVLGHAGHGPGVQRLQQQGPQAADQHRQVAVDPPGHAVGPEQAAIALGPLEAAGRVGLADQQTTDLRSHPAAHRIGQRQRRVGQAPRYWRPVH